jgi:hypothetical protein
MIENLIPQIFGMSSVIGFALYKLPEIVRFIANIIRG